MGMSPPVTISFTKSHGQHPFAQLYCLNNIINHSKSSKWHIKAGTVSLSLFLLILGPLY